jgi:hypothetical protein
LVFRFYLGLCLHGKIQRESKEGLPYVSSHSMEAAFRFVPGLELAAVGLNGGTSGLAAIRGRRNLGFVDQSSAG